MRHQREWLSSASAKYLALIWALSLGAALQAQNDWPVYGHDSGATRYSPLTQINSQNVGKLQRVWSYATPEEIHSPAPTIQSGRAGEPAACGLLQAVTDGECAREPPRSRLW